MRRWVMGALLAVTLGCSGILGTPLEQMEGSYMAREDWLEDLEERAAPDPDLAAEIEADQARFAQEYAELPTGETQREEQLGDLNVRMMDAVNAYELRVSAMEEAAAAAADAESAAAIADLRPKLTGNWVGSGYVLSIDASGTVHYENNSGGMDKTIDAPLANLTPTGFDVGALGVYTHFDIDVPPTQQPDGTWTMTLSGVKYVRQ